MVLRAQKEYELFIYDICDIAKKYNCNVWEGRSKNRFSVTLSTCTNRENRLNISIKLFKNNIYKVCFSDEINPNSNKVGDYNMELGSQKCYIFFRKRIKKIYKKIWFTR